MGSVSGWVVGGQPSGWNQMSGIGIVGQSSQEPRTRVRSQKSEAGDKAKSETSHWSQERKPRSGTKDRKQKTSCIRN